MFRHGGKYTAWLISLSTYIYAFCVTLATKVQSVLYSPLARGSTESAVHEAPWTEGDVVRKLRLVAGWKLKHLAKRAGVSLTMIHELEMGKTKEAKRATLARIAEAFGLTYRDFMDLVPQHPVRYDVSAPRPDKRTGAPSTDKSTVSGRRSG